jgi:hypothetical protein
MKHGFILQAHEIGGLMTGDHQTPARTSHGTRRHRAE